MISLFREEGSPVIFLGYVETSFFFNIGGDAILTLRVGISLFMHPVHTGKYIR